MSGKKTFIFALADPLIPQTDQVTIKKTLNKKRPLWDQNKLLEKEDADHGFISEQREGFSPKLPRMAGYY
tara:strand:- start:141 stop:350 length:210 start_codon:yes stop_codon:yes gene_type:complete